MTSDQAVSASATAISARATRLEGWKWRRAAFFLAGAAQLITIAALLSADPISANWAALLLAIAPAFLTAAVAFLGPPIARLASVAAAAVLIAAIAGSFQHVGPMFLLALAALAIGAVPLWRTRS
jgi:hypothetical protein